MSLRIVTAATAAACLLAFGAGVPAARASADDNNDLMARSLCVDGFLSSSADTFRVRNAGSPEFLNDDRHKLT